MVRVLRDIPMEENRSILVTYYLVLSRTRSIFESIFTKIQNIPDKMLKSGAITFNITRSCLIRKDMDKKKVA
jgi:hypothetical protein